MESALCARRNEMDRNQVLLTIAAALLAVAGVLLLLSGSPQPVQAAGTICVAPGGSGCNVAVCGGTCYASVQTAVDAASTDDEILVATGTYTGVQSRGGMTQVVYISKTVTVRGGYSSDLTAWNPDTYPTTLDAQRQGRVVSIVVGGVGPTLEGFTITGGNANGLTANCPNVGGLSDGCGGGIFVYQAHPIIVNNVVTNNVAAVSTGAHSASGGGLCLSWANGSVITGNLIISNTTSLGNRGMGGGIHLYFPHDVLVAANQIVSNTATTHSSLYGWGGGIAVGGSGAVATIQDNRIEGNRTNSGTNGGQGAGIYNWYSWSNFVGNQVVGNYGRHAVYLGYNDMARFESNQVVDNSTTIGVKVVNGGISGPTLVNNVIARSGDRTLSFSSYSGAPLTATLIHNTLIGADTGYGIYVESGYVTLFLTNTIIANHTWGITNTVPASSTVVADHTLFWANDQDGVTGANPVYGDPAFIDLGGGGYHLGPGSAAIDAGMVTVENVDIDGDTRPIGPAPDIGADEAWPGVFLPLVLRNY
jgi:hypothetical protein